MYDGGGMRVGRDQEQAREAAVEHADAWTRGQAARLQTSPAVILDAIKRGWLPENIQEVTSRYAFEDAPPLGAGLRVIRELRSRRAA